MAKSKEDFGAFGSRRRERTSPLKIFIRVVVLVALLVVAPVAYFGWTDVALNLLEKTNPTINVQNPPVGLGEDTLIIKFRLADEGAGLDEVIVRSEQDGEVKDLLKKDYHGERATDDVVSLEIPGKKSGLREGSARLLITAFDRSFWSNRAQATLELKVDYKRPEIEVVTTQHNAVVGGAELVFYRLVESDTAFSGIKVGEWLFPGFQAKNLDKDFEARPDIYFTFFPIPVGFDPKKDQMRIFARDSVGNMATAGMYYRIKPFKQPVEKIELTRELLTGPVAELFEDYLKLAKDAGKYEALKNAETDEALVQRFRVVNENYREFIQQSLVSLLSQPKQSRFWTARFSRLSGASQRSQFAEDRYYSYMGLDAGRSDHYGVDLAATPHLPVEAANSGIVIFADSLGIYGKTVVIDHGFGLSTLYGHLSAVAVHEGDRVEQNQIIGNTGATGLAGGDHLHFEFRLHGIPVRPIEWWDQNWLTDHIDTKIDETKKALGISVLKPLESTKRP